MSVGPEEFVGHVVDGEGVGPGEPVLVGDDAAEIGAVQTEPADVGLQVPRGEVQVAGARVDDDGARIRNAVGLERAPVGAVQFGHFDVLRVTVEPVDLAAHPVDGDAFQTHRVVFDNHLTFQ